MRLAAWPFRRREFFAPAVNGPLRRFSRAAGAVLAGAIERDVDWACSPEGLAELTEAVRDLLGRHHCHPMLGDPGDVHVVNAPDELQIVGRRHEGRPWRLGVDENGTLARYPSFPSDAPSRPLTVEMRRRLIRDEQGYLRGIRAATSDAPRCVARRPRARSRSHRARRTGTRSSRAGPGGSGGDSAGGDGPGEPPGPLDRLTRRSAVAGRRA
jgi:hypothetical protein